MASSADFVTDYLVVGAGTAGLSFVDELLDRTSATFLIVDTRALPGGQWVDAYPYVRLHQPSDAYGVQSKELSTTGNGWDLASGSEVQAYYYSLMRDRFLPSGRVTFLPSTEFLSDDDQHQEAILQQRLSGKKLTVRINTKLVDASFQTAVIPLTHKRSFDVEEHVKCIPPNHLPSLASNFRQFTVLGGGKTGTDACLWLLEQGVDPKQISWVIPADYWFFNRIALYIDPKANSSILNSFITLFETIGTAKDARDVTEAYEKAGVFLRLDHSIYPDQFHAATVTPQELDILRPIPVIRMGHVIRIDPHELTMTKGKAKACPDTLYIDCTAHATPSKPNKAVFQPRKIVIQFIQIFQIAPSSAKIALLESLSDMSDEDRNLYAKPMRTTKNIDGMLEQFQIEIQNRIQAAQNPAIQKWESQCRLTPVGNLVANIKPEEVEMLGLVQRLQASVGAAAQNMPELIASLETGPIYE